MSTQAIYEPVSFEEIAALRAFPGLLAHRYRALLARALDELVARRLLDEKQGESK